MSDTQSTTPRRPIMPAVPGPNNPGIAAKAVALREQKAREVFAEPPAPLPPRAPLPPDAPLYRVSGPVGNLAKGISGVMTEVGTISKSGYNKFHGYAYATLQDLLYAVTPLMGKHGVCIIQNEVERTAAETRIMVTYEFSIFHTSGEMWPERPRFTGMAIGRNQKGEWDDKAINKCHSAARKYFLLSLFQVPSGDFDDADEGPAQPAATKQQPSQTERANTPQQPRINERPRTVPGPATPDKQPRTNERPATKIWSPHKIGFTEGMTADKWAGEYLFAIKTAKSQQEITEWDGLNDATLQRLSDKYPEVYEQVRAAAEQRMEQLAPPLVVEVGPENAMPDPAKDAQEAMNWVAQSLVDAPSYETAELFWNGMVAPREKEFDPADWELLMNEWRRAEIRLNTDVEPDAPEI